MQRPFLTLAGVCCLVMLACGNSSVASGGPPAAPTATRIPTATNAPTPSYLTQKEAPGYSYNPYVDDGATQPLSEFCVNIGGCFPHMDCANVDWAVFLVNAAPDGRVVGPATWQTATGASDIYGNIANGTAPDITVSPSSGYLAPGAQVLIHVTGSYSGGRVFGVKFFDPHSPVGTFFQLKCQA